MSLHPGEIGVCSKHGPYDEYCGKCSDEKKVPKLKSLGESKTVYPMTYDPSVLETFPNPQQETEYVIEIEAPEFTCLCPKTGQPDFAKILVSYSPDEKCVESKSFKLYLFSFRQSGAFHEDVTNRIAKDLFDLMQPHWVQVTGQFFPRGGISFHPTVRLEKDNIDNLNI